MVLKGTPVSPGVALGEVYAYTPFSYEIPEVHCALGGVARQKERLLRALQAAAEELQAIISSFAGEQADKGEIFAAHQEILNDEEIVETALDKILAHNKTADFAVHEVFEEFIVLISAAKDPLIAARAADYYDVRNRLLRVLGGKKEENLSSLPGPVVIVARDLLPSDTATLDRKNVLGIVTEAGSATSHTAIIAGSYHIPAVLGVADCTTLLADGLQIGLDALSGRVYLQPGHDTRAMLLQKQARWQKQQQEEKKYLTKEALMRDGIRLQIGINIGSGNESDDYQNCDFIGLFRTEFLYMENARPPTEEEQFRAYKRVMERAAGKPVTLRTLDIGGDKALRYIDFPHENNPFLGKRGLRFCLDNPAVFRTQLRAALRASCFGEMWVMLPMVGSIDDIRNGRRHFEAAKAELEREGVSYGSNVKFGIMVEVPAIAAIADLVADEVDFASIGTNDLCQYLCAADRMNPGVTDFYQSFSPAMVRTLGAVADAFNRAGKPVSVCGEMAGDPKAAILLAGLGIRKLSMGSAKIAGVKAALANITLKDAAILAQKAQQAKTQGEVLALFGGWFFSDK